MFYIDIKNSFKVREALDQFDHEIEKMQEYTGAIEWLQKNKNKTYLMIDSSSFRIELPAEVVDVIIAEYQRRIDNLENTVRIPVESSGA